MVCCARVEPRSRQVICNGLRALLTLAHNANPENPLRVIDLADLRLAQGDEQAALDLYRRAAEMERRSLYAQAMRAMIGASLGMTDEATAGLAAIDDYWRSSNDLLEWAWNVRREWLCRIALFLAIPWRWVCTPGLPLPRLISRLGAGRWGKDGCGCAAAAARWLCDCTDQLGVQ
ncbi:MAG: hypothetical protein RMJ48_00690 [Roseiflexaceae bacterium]|nr:hypothetical protein [Roseiflexaceae bacterium]